MHPRVVVVPSKRRVERPRDAVLGERGESTAVRHVWDEVREDSLKLGVEHRCRQVGAEELLRAHVGVVARHIPGIVFFQPWPDGYTPELVAVHGQRRGKVAS